MIQVPKTVRSAAQKIMKFSTISSWNLYLSNNVIIWFWYLKQSEAPHKRWWNFRPFQAEWPAIDWTPSKGRKLSGVGPPDVPIERWKCFEARMLCERNASNVFLGKNRVKSEN